MITAKSNALKNTMLNVKAGVDLQFDKTGSCTIDDPEIAILLYAHSGMLVEGLEGEFLERAIARKDAIKHQASVDKTIQFSGVANPVQEKAKAAANVAVYSVPGGKIAKDVKIKIELAEEARARRLAKSTVNDNEITKEEPPRLVVTIPPDPPESKAWEVEPKFVTTLKKKA